MRKLAVLTERTRLAREFHDDLGGQLVLINLNLQLVEDLIADDPQAALAQLVTTREQLHITWRSLITAADATLTITGTSLPTALHDLVEQCRSFTPAHVGLHIAGGLEGLSDAAACTIYRAAQEGLTNACKYATQAQTIGLVVACGSDGVSITVCDDGRPCEAAPVSRRLPAMGIDGGFGLVGLRERAELLHGMMDAGPLPQGGFQLHLRLPAETARS